MPAERITLHRTNVDKTEVIEQYPKTIASQVYDFENGKFLDKTLQEKIKIHPTVASMKADRSLKVGMVVETNSYRFVFDGGQGKYRIVDNPSLIDDGGSIHDLQNGLKAELLFEKNRINIKQFGAYGGSGYQDDTQVILNAASFVNTSLSNASSSFYGGGTIFFPAGVYICTQPINLNVNVRLEGEGSRGFEYYPGKAVRSIISFRDFSNRYTAAIRVFGYLQNGTTPNGYNVTVVQADNSIVSADGFSMIDLGIESFGDLKISVGLNLINATTSRISRISIVGFKYAGYVSCSWGSSFDGVFTVTTLGGFIFTDSNAGISLTNSYLTVSNNIIIEGEEVTELITTMPHPRESFGVLCSYAYLTMTNVIIERANLAVVALDSKVNILGMTNERISTSIFDAVNSNFSVDGYWIFNPPEQTAAVLRAENSNITLKNTDFKNYARVINADSNSFVSIINSKNTDNFEFTSNTAYNKINNDRVTSSTISFVSNFIVPVTPLDAANKVYKQGLSVWFNLRGTVTPALPLNVEFLAGQLPLGYRPSFEQIIYSRNCNIRITTTGGIYLMPTATTEFIVSESINFLLN